MAGSTRIKVARMTLIEKMEQRLGELQAAHVEAQAVYEKEIADFVKELKAALTAYISALAKDSDAALEAVENHYRGETQITVKLRVGTRCPKPPELKTSQLERSLGVLRSAADDFIPVSTDDEYAKYL